MADEQHTTPRSSVHRPSRQPSTSSTTSSDRVPPPPISSGGYSPTAISPTYLTVPHSTKHDSAHGNFGLSDFPDNLEVEVIERLSQSHVSLKELVELARDHDPEAFVAARQQVEVQYPSSSGKNRFAAESLEVLCKEFGLENAAHGLSPVQLRKQRDKHGHNVLEKESQEAIWRLFLHQFLSLIVLLLLAAAVVCLALQEWVEGAAILIIVFINAVLATYMERSAGNALAKLASMAAPKCTVLRDGGQELVIDATDVVPGDVVVLSTGVSVPADMRLISLVELKADEAILTGESEEVKKTLEAKDKDAPFATSLCFASTSITNGYGTGLVVATGMETQVGRIAKQLKKAGAGSKLTPLQRGLNRLGGLIGIIAIAVLAVVVVIAIVTDYQDPAHPDKNKILTIVLVAVGFAVSSIPEGLPMVVTISLALGARDMVKRKANVRKLPAVETLGCCSVICSDKTGTLTEGKMTAVKLVTVCRGAALRNNTQHEVTKTFSFYPTKGFDPNGGVFDDDQLTEVKKAAMMELYQQGLVQQYDQVETDYGNPENESQDAAAQRVRSLLLSGYLNSHGTRLICDPTSQRWTTAGNMSEGAIVVAAAKARWNETNALYHRISEFEVPFNSSRKMMATVHKLPVQDTFGSLSLDGGYTHVAIVKGAPDRVMQHVRHVLRETSEGHSAIDWSTPISTAEADGVGELNLELSQAALRVLAFTIRPLNDADVKQLMSCDGADERLQYLLGIHGEKKLTLLGVMGSLDPPRPGVSDAVTTCRGAGVRVIMITGDQKPTACAIARDIGLIGAGEDAETVGIECRCLHMNGDSTEPHLEDAEIDEITSRVNVFSRAQPEDRITIVDSLRRQGHVVAMTGDGVNDAPALKAADIGVAMGIVGTDVAKGAAEMVLLDDNFCTIVGAIDEGRKIYANIQKFVCFLLGTNIGEIIYLTVAIASFLPLPLEALQILFLNLMSDGCPAVALSREPADADNMKKPPRPRNQQIMTRDWWLFGNLPHTIFEAACVLASLCLALYMSLGVLQLQDIEKQCWRVDIPVQDSSDTINFRYFCRSFEYVVAGTYYNSWVTHIDYWNPQTGEMVQRLGALPGMVEDISVHDSRLPQDIQDAHVDGCQASKGLKPMPSVSGSPSGWCMPDGSQPVHNRDSQPVGAAAKEYIDVSARGSKRARTQSFVTAVFCEMLRAYTVRSWSWFWQVFNRNMWMHVACALSAVLTIIVTVTPGLTFVFSTTMLEVWQYAFAISWGVLNLILDELIPKPLYRYYRERNKRKAEALAAREADKV